MRHAPDSYGLFIFRSEAKEHVNPFLAADGYGLLLSAEPRCAYADSITHGLGRHAHDKLAAAVGNHLYFLELMRGFRLWVTADYDFRTQQKETGLLEYGPG